MNTHKGQHRAAVVADPRAKTVGDGWTGTASEKVVAIVQSAGHIAGLSTYH
jgi:hypothetical protein